MPAALICIVLRIKGLFSSTVAYSQNLFLSRSVLWGLSFDLQPAIDGEGRGSAEDEGDLVLASCLFNCPCFLSSFPHTDLSAFSSICHSQEVRRCHLAGASPQVLDTGAVGAGTGNMRTIFHQSSFGQRRRDRAMKTLLTSFLKTSGTAAFKQSGRIFFNKSWMWQLHFLYCAGKRITVYLLQRQEDWFSLGKSVRFLDLESWWLVECLGLIYTKFSFCCFRPPFIFPHAIFPIIFSPCLVWYPEYF